MKTNEGYPADWARVVLMVSPDGKQMHAIGGDREPGDGDTPYVGLKRIEKASTDLVDLVNMLHEALPNLVMGSVKDGQPYAIACISGNKIKIKLMNVPESQRHEVLKKLNAIPWDTADKRQDEIAVGDYVLATKYYDGDPCDHFCVGFVSGHTRHGRYLIVDNDGYVQRRNGFRRAERITKYEGDRLVALFPEISDKPGESLWRHLEKIREELREPEKYGTMPRLSIEVDKDDPFVIKIPSDIDCRWTLSARGADAQQEYEKNDKPYWAPDFDKFTLTLKSSNAELLFRKQGPRPVRLDIDLVAKSTLT